MRTHTIYNKFRCLFAYMRQSEWCWKGSSLAVVIVYDIFVKRQIWDLWHFGFYSGKVKCAEYEQWAQIILMFNCGKKRNRNKGDISKIEKMAEVIDDGGNNSKSNSNNIATATAAGGAVVVVTTGSGGNNNSNGVTDASCVTVNHLTNNLCRNNANNSNQNNSGANNSGSRQRTFQRFSCSRCCNDIFNYLMRLRVSPEELEQRYKSREIDKFLEKDKHTFRRQVQISSFSHSVTPCTVIRWLIHVRGDKNINMFSVFRNSTFVAHVFRVIYFRCNFINTCELRVNNNKKSYDRE